MKCPPVATEQTHSPAHWNPYQPTEQTPWNLRRVVHLHRRAGFAATWGEIQRDLVDGPEASIERVLSGSPRTESAVDDFDAMARIIADAAVRSKQPDRLKAWWMYRMLFTPHPLTEKMTLLWHNHFATSNRKLDDLSLMRRQNDLFRTHALAPFGQLLHAVVHDPALLLWLDAPANHKGHPNENLARELLELFTLGIGHYDETDVKEAARALTGWTVTDDEFEYRPDFHDESEKDILGQKRSWDGDQLLELLLDQPATAHRLAGRLCQQFLGEGVAEAKHIDSLAEGLQAHDLDIAWGVENILRSELFFSDENIRYRVAEPAEFIVGAIRALELSEPPPRTIILADWMTRLGQDLFYPPNVGGWNGGRDWLRTGALISRSNVAVGLSRGQISASQSPPNWEVFAAKHGCSAKREEFVSFLADLLFGGEPTAGWIDGIVQVVTSKSNTPGTSLQEAVATVLASPEAQLN
ncbi:MAG TPA: DUF1800 domain-containing protein [Planctomycetaceae bacterium]|nr:DUF1800 domain-containing protein [Planctomycetaceae bacterium]